jgi:RimJ/RimL family protein N-acetyltransferase
MTFTVITEANIDLLASFINEMEEEKKLFRYFNSRPLSVIKNHLYTIIGFNDIHSPVAYGHLDLENDKVWLGICVLNGHSKLGYGKKTMEELITRATQIGVKTIHLTVDIDNLKAIRLYEFFNFKRNASTEKYFSYSLNL